MSHSAAAEIVEHLLLVRQHSGLVPGFAVLIAATHIGDRKEIPPCSSHSSVDAARRV
jgi:hypothetical protein